MSELARARKEIYLPDIVGSHYGSAWRFKGDYLVIKGSRSSKKSKTIALRWIYLMMKYPEANLIVIRKTYRTLKDSCFKELKWAIKKLGVEHLWKIKESPLEMTYIPTGQQIYFRGLDDPMKVTSITVDVGVLCWGWLEEAFEVKNEEDFDTIDESLRGDLPEGLFYQWVLTLNPWNHKHWIKKRFFDVNDPDIMAITTNYLMNEFIDAKTLKKFDKMKERNPARYKVAGLGEWGILEGLIYNLFADERDKYLVDADEYIKESNKAVTQQYLGIDWGEGQSANASVNIVVLGNYEEIIVTDEFYDDETEYTANKLFDEHIKVIKRNLKYGGVQVYADYSGRTLTNSLRTRVARSGMRAVVDKCKKHPIRDRIDAVNILFEEDRLKIDRKCEHLIEALETAVWNDKVVKQERLDNGTSNIDSLDAFEYALCKIMYKLVKLDGRKGEKDG